MTPHRHTIVTWSQRHGMNLQVIASPAGDILWVSGPLPGAVHARGPTDLGRPARLEAAADLLADKGYQGSTYAKIPYRARQPESQKAANPPTRSCAPATRNAQLKTWRILRKLRCCPWRAGNSPRPSTYCRSRSITG